MNVPVMVVAPREGKDYSDHRDAGHGFEVTDFVTEATAYTRPRGMTADELVSQEFKPAVWAVAGVLPVGLTVFAAPPKIGKSWCALDFCAAVASGGRALGGQLPTTLGSALYLAREDNYRRLQQRMKYLMGGDPSPRKLELIPSEQDWPGGEQGLSNLTDWAEEVRDPRLVVIDTIVKVEPAMGGGGVGRGGNAYNENYSMMSSYKTWAEAHDCAVVMIHHDSKPSGVQKWCHETGEDPFTRISGTRGLTGAADTLIFLEAMRGQPKGFLRLIDLVAIVH
jgi:RecA-family ATPase